MWTTRTPVSGCVAILRVPSDGHSNRNSSCTCAVICKGASSLSDGIRRSRLETRVAALCGRDLPSIGTSVRPPSVTLTRSLREHDSGSRTYNGPGDVSRTGNAND